MKKIVAWAASLLLSIGTFAFPAAAEAPIRVTDYSIAAFTEGSVSGFYLYFHLSQNIANARHFQSTERKPEPGVPADAWKFPDEMSKAAGDHLYVNDISLAEYIDSLGSPYSAVCLFIEKDKKTQQQHLIIKVPDSLPGCKMDTDDFALVVKDGFISAEKKKFEPFKALWNHRTKKLAIYRANDDGLSLDEVNSGTPVTPPETTVAGKTDPKSTANPTANRTDNAVVPSATATDGGTTASETGITTAPTGSDTVLPVLGRYDLTPKSKDIQIDFASKEISLSQSMRVGEFLEKLEAVEGYQVGVFNGPLPIEESEYIYTGYKCKVRVNDALIGNFLIKAPEPSDVSTVLLVVLIAAGVVVLAGGGILLWLLVLKKKRGEKIT